MEARTEINSSDRGVNTRFGSTKDHLTTNPHNISFVNMLVPTCQANISGQLLI